MQQPYYHFKCNPVVSGLRLTIPATQFRCGAVDPHDKNCVVIDLPETVVDFARGTGDQFADIYVVPTSDGIDHYYIDEYPGEGFVRNPPTDLFAGNISPVAVISMMIPSAGALTVTVNEFDTGWSEPRDGIRQAAVAANGKLVKACAADAVPAGWEILELPKHQGAFPVCGLGELPSNQIWIVEV